jgi:thiamine-phosphate pyrophosphorylase
VSLPNSSPSDQAPPSGRKPILCYVSDRRSLPVPTQQDPTQQDLIAPLLEKIALVAAAGVDWIQLREKDLSGRQTAALTREALRSVSKPANCAQSLTRVLVRILVNDRLDVALAEQAGGVHLGENSLPVEEANRLVRASHATPTRPRDFLVGVSAHSLEAAKSAASAGADYVFFGPVFATPSKSAYGAPQGLERLAEVCASVAIPVLAIGGLTLENAHACLSAGASGLAAIRLFQDSSDPAGIVRVLRQQNF